MSAPRNTSPAGWGPQGQTPSPALVAELRTLALRAATLAGDMLVDGQAHVEQVGSKTSAVDVVTQMDVASEQLLVAHLMAKRPLDAVLGEEGGERPGSSPVRWVIDPLDGTVNYLYGLPAWAVSVAAEWHGRAIAGAVVAPALDEAYHAGMGMGAVSDRAQREEYGRRIRVRPPAEMAQSLVGTGFGYLPERRGHQGDVLAPLLPEVRDIRRCGAAAVDLCWLAAGRLDAYFERGLQPWDRAAGVLIAREAGAIVTGSDGGEPDGEFTLGASGPELHEQLLQRLTGLGAHIGP